MLSFLNCIETGLLPRGRLDPPLWSQRSSSTNNKRRRPLPSLSESEETTTKDYVFRIIDNSNHKEFRKAKLIYSLRFLIDVNCFLVKRKDLMDTHTQLPTKVRVQLGSSSTSSESSMKSLSIEQSVSESPPNVCIQAVCDSMKRQIISRAFYGWLAYCRHLSTVRTHLSGLVNPNIVGGDSTENGQSNFFFGRFAFLYRTSFLGLTLEKWLTLCVDGIVNDYEEVYRLTYYGGIAHELRKEIWPYLLGHYKFGSTIEERNQLSEETRQS